MPADRFTSEKESQLGRRDFLRLAAAAAAGVATASWTGIAQANSPPVWSQIPNQVWNVGDPVYLDLADYCDDPDGHILQYGLDKALPPGVTLNGSVISGTPTASYSSTSFTATAQDGQPPSAPLGAGLTKLP